MSRTPQYAVKHIVSCYHCLVEVYLPIHKTAGDDKLLDGIDALLVDHKSVVLDIQHIDDTFGTDNTLADTCKEGIPTQIVETVHIQLRRHELVKEMTRIAVGENGNSHIQLSVELFIQALHKHEGECLVMDVAEGAFGGMGEGTVTDIVQQYCQLHPNRLLMTNLYTFGTQDVDGALGEVEGAKHVRETGMDSAGIYQVGESQLLDMSLTLKERMRNDIKNDIFVYRQKPIYRVIDYLALIGH